MIFGMKEKLIILTYTSVLLANLAIKYTCAALWLLVLQGHIRLEK